MSTLRRLLLVVVCLLSLDLSAACGPSPTPAAPTPAVPLSSGSATATAADAAAIEIAIEVAPNVLNLLSQGEVVTVHTNLPYGAVVGASVSMNGVAIAWWKADNRGQFVAKFVMSAVKSLPLKIGEYNVLRIEGTKTDGTPFWGEKAVLVVNNASGG